MKFLEKPNIPNKRTVTVIADYRMSSQSIKSLNILGISVIPTAGISRLQTAVCGHADMMINHIKNNRFVVVAEAYEHFLRAMPNAELIKGSAKLKADYPNDVLYNCASFGKYVVCNAACAASEILSEYQRMNRELVNVNQGYSKCSICVVNENAIITADKGISKRCKSAGIDVLEISAGNIELKGMHYGFIGGASGLIDKNILAVNGELKTHPDGAAITSFCKNYGVDIYELQKGYLTDIGSILPILEV